MSIAQSDVEDLLVPALKDGIRRHSLREQIASSLADLIAAGLLREGDELPPERELAALLEVSRDSLRGALQLLAERDILTIGHGTRTRVRPNRSAIEESRRFDLRQLADVTDGSVIEARRVLEPDLARRAASRIDDATVRRLRKLIDAQKGMTGDPVRFQISDREFHMTIFAAADSPVLTSFATEAYDYAYTYRRKLMKHHDGIRIAVIDHERVVSALQARDPDAAETAMRGHMDKIATLLAEARAAPRTTR